MSREPRAWDHPNGETFTEPDHYSAPAAWAEVRRSDADEVLSPRPCPPPPSPRGIKHDAGKPRWDLVPWDGMALFVEVLTLGAQKYTDRNWESGLTYSRLFAATLRHLIAWWGGEDLDPETGKSHIAHAVCNLVFLLTFIRRGRGALDNRPGTK